MQEFNPSRESNAYNEASLFENENNAYAHTEAKVYSMGEENNSPNEQNYNRNKKSSVKKSQDDSIAKSLINKMAAITFSSSAVFTAAVAVVVAILSIVSAYVTFVSFEHTSYGANLQLKLELFVEVENYSDKDFEIIDKQNTNIVVVFKNFSSASAESDTKTISLDFTKISNDIIESNNSEYNEQNINANNYEYDVSYEFEMFSETKTQKMLVYHIEIFMPNVYADNANVKVFDDKNVYLDRSVV